MKRESVGRLPSPAVRSLVIGLCVVVAIILILPQKTWLATTESRFNQDEGWWSVQSVDTMKFSRDVARAELNNQAFDETIDFQVKNIAGLGATHVAVGTPYDEEFVPFLRRWVQAARKYNLNVWFRGNFAGWEKWFEYRPISRGEHLSKLEKFIADNPDLFADGDIFTSCPECENGGPGDPRKNGEVSAYREFLVQEFTVADSAFKKIGKDVHANYFSMNGDVAELVMDKDTTNKLGGIVVVDHYVGTPEELVRDVKNYAERSGGKVVLGEVGVPIPDIHGTMTEEERALWLYNALAMLSDVDQFLGVNYWVFSGGSTALWEASDRRATIADVLESFYKPKKLTVRITNELGYGIPGASATAGSRTFYSDANGNVEIAAAPGITELQIAADGYKSFTQKITHPDNKENIVLEQERDNLLFKAVTFLRDIFVR